MNKRDNAASETIMINLRHVRAVIVMVSVGLFMTCTAARVVYAVVLGFTPGDAFFHSELTAKNANANPGDDPSSLVLDYVYARMNGGFGGYAGFHKLRITNIPEAMRQQLKEAYGRLREEVPREIRVPNGSKPDDGKEINGFELFVYNKNVDWSKQRLAVKYNEDWWRAPDHAQADIAERPFGLPIAAQVYYSFVDTTDAVIHDWKHASTIPSLKATIPKAAPWGFSGPMIEDEVVVDAKDVQIVILLTDDLPLYFAQDPRLPFVSLTIDGVSLISWNNGKQAITYNWDPGRRPYGTIDDLLLMDMDEAADVKKPNKGN